MQENGTHERGLEIMKQGLNLNALVARGPLGSSMVENRIYQGNRRLVQAIFATQVEAPPTTQSK